MIRGGGGGELGGIGPGDEVFCSMHFLESIDHGSQHRPTAGMKPHSQLLSIQQSANILCDRLVLLTAYQLSPVTGEQKTLAWKAFS
jgi:hypothetical protein